jgi:site-specific recombinase XerD
MLGHASLAVTQRYLHVNEEGLRAAALATSLSTEARPRAA